MSNAQKSGHVESEPGPDAYFRKQLAEGTLTIQACTECGEQIFYPRQICPFCASRGLEWVPCDGKGTVYSTSVVRRKPDRGGDYNIAIVELQGGARLMSQVVDILPADVKIGMPVVATIRHENDTPILLFTQDSEARG